MDSLAGLRIALYARFSSENQNDTSIEAQVLTCRQYAESRGGVIHKSMIFTDRAQSGDSVARDDFERLYALVRAVPSKVDVVIVRDTKRISRDVGDADRFYKQAEYAGVRVICVAEGIDSARPGAKRMFSFQAMAGEQYLDDLRVATLGGLERAVDNGWSAGGLPIGYRSKPLMVVAGKQKHFEILIDEEGKKTVNRIFELYRDGQSPMGIAALFNKEGVPPPRAHTKHRRKGWVASTIREILRNEAYIGVWRFKRKQWRKIPETPIRRYRLRPEPDVMTRQRPHLRIIDQELWDEVAARRSAVAAKHTGKNKGAASGRRAAYPLSGLLFCASCGAPMIVLGGTSATYYRCSDALKRGTCRNRLGVREDVVVEAAVGELKRVLLQPDLLEYLRARVEEKLRGLKANAKSEESKVEQQLKRVTLEIERQIEFIKNTDPVAEAGVVQAIRASLTKASAEQANLRRQLEAARAADHPVRLPTPEQIVAGALDIEARLRSDPLTAREALRAMLLDGRITMEPQADGSYIGRSILTPLRLARTRKPRGRGGAEASSLETRSVSKVSCAGRI